MHSTQKPLSAISLAATQANFPALQHFFPITEAADLAGMHVVDTVNGLDINLGTTSTDVDGVSVNLSSVVLDAPLTGGTWQPHGSKVIVSICMGTDFDLGMFIMGSSAADNSTDAIRSGNGPAILDASVGTTDASTALSVQAISMNALVVDLGNAELTSAEAMAASTTVNAPTAIVNTLNLDAIGAIFSCTFDTFYGAAVLHFDAAPTDLAAALAWMRYEWANGNKAIYPGWKDKV